MNSLGSELKYLGQVTGLVEEDLIPGDPAVAEELAAHLMKLGAAFEKAGEGFKRIDAGGWEGKAADAAREYLTATLPPRWLAAADAHTEAGTAVQDYARVLADAKARAEQAKQALDRANAESEKARLAHNAAVERYNADPGAGAAPPECSDPGAQARAQAEREIAAAKAAVADADLRAARIVGRAMEAAPAEPGMLAQLAANAEDLVQGLGAGVGSLVGGAVDAVVGLGTTVVGAVGFMTTYGNPAWTMTHPQEFAQFNAQVDGLVKAAATDPAGFGYQVGKTMLNVEGWKNDPLRAAGEMVPDAVGSIVGGAGIASRVGRSVGKVGDVAGDLGKTAGRVDGVPRHTPEPPPRPQPPAPQPRPEPPAPQQQPRPEHPSAQPRQQAPSPQQPSSPTTPWGDYNDLPPSTAHHAPRTPHRPGGSRNPATRPARTAASARWAAPRRSSNRHPVTPRKSTAHRLGRAISTTLLRDRTNGQPHRPPTHSTGFPNPRCRPTGTATTRTDRTSRATTTATMIHPGTVVTTRRRAATAIGQVSTSCSRNQGHRSTRDALCTRSGKRSTASTETSPSR
ncbi:putative T7SS-secreted protein [Saccharopolyspora spinosporotrichia]